MKQLEQRVKTLEYEIKILKNEVQRTLLDIQEQILVHYYPSLRSENDGPSEGTIQSIETIRQKKKQLGGKAASAPRPAQPAAGPPSGGEPAAGESAAPDPRASTGPKMKEVSLDEARAQRPSPNDVPTPVEDAERKEQDEMVVLSGWVSSTAKRIGKDPTSTLVRAYIEQDILSPHVEQPLLRLIGLIDQSDTPDNVAVNDILRAVMKLDELLGRDSDIDEALTIIEQAHLG
jgi:cell division septation protein DedD